MKGYIHTINRLPPADTFGGSIIDDMRTGGHVAYEVDHVLLGSKTGPYSEKDAFAIYDGTDAHLTTFLDLPHTVQRSMLTIAWRVGKYLWETYKQDIIDGKEFLVIGTNVGMKPGPRMIQTIPNTHFHATAFPQYAHGENSDVTKLTRVGVGDHLDDGRLGKSSTAVVTIDESSENHKRIFCIRPNNLLLRAGFREQERNWTETNLFTLDRPLTVQGDIFTSEANMVQFHQTYAQALQYLKTVRMNGNQDNRGFGISIVYNITTQTWNIRLAFMEKNDSQDNGSICDSSGHAILRVVVNEIDRIIDNRPFVKQLATAVFN